MTNVRFEYRGQVSAGLNSWDRDSNKRVIVELNDDDLTVDELLEEFMNFMKATGYSFNLGDRLEVVNDFKNLPAEQTAAPQSQPIVDEGGTVIGMAAPLSDPY